MPFLTQQTLSKTMFPPLRPGISLLQQPPSLRQFLYTHFYASRSLTTLAVGKEDSSPEGYHKVFHDLAYVKETDGLGRTRSERTQCREALNSFEARSCHIHPPRTLPPDEKKLGGLNRVVLPKIIGPVVPKDVPTVRPWSMKRRRLEKWRRVRADKIRSKDSLLDDAGKLTTLGGQGNQGETKDSLANRYVEVGGVSIGSRRTGSMACCPSLKEEVKQDDDPSTEDTAERMNVNRAGGDSEPMVIFSGIQPTGIPHLGNYLGALQTWVRLQDEVHERNDESSCYFCVVDLHAITKVMADKKVEKNEDGDLIGGQVESRADELKRLRFETMASLIAIGLDPKKSCLFYQSHVPAHSELMWLLSSVTSMGQLSRMTQWKDKSKSLKAGQEKLGLFTYPVLQAADILVHGATHVPVGEDQVQHLEFARSLCDTFNSTYGHTCLKHPQTILSPFKRVMSLTDPTKKMSKSATNPKSRILITDSPEVIKSRIMSAVTDSTNTISYDPVLRPGVSNLIALIAHFDDQKRSPEQLAQIMGPSEINCDLKTLKELAAESVIRGLSGIRERYEAAIENTRELRDIAGSGSGRAGANASQYLKLAKRAMGFRRYGI